MFFLIIFFRNPETWRLEFQCVILFGFYLDCFFVFVLYFEFWVHVYSDAFTDAPEHTCTRSGGTEGQVKTT